MNTKHAQCTCLYIQLVTKLYTYGSTCSRLHTRLQGVPNAVIHHPNVVDIPTIAEYHTKAKLTCLSSILTSKDPMISEISELLLDQDFTRSQRIPSEVNQILDLAKNSISTYHVNAQVSIGIIVSNTGITNLAN